MARFYEELKRRKVFRVAAAYVITAWLLIQIIVAIKEPLSLPDWSDTLVIILLAGGFFVACLLAWAYEISPDGIRAEDSGAATGDVAPTSRRHRLDTVLAVLLVFVVAVIGLQIFLPEARNDEPIMLVLPFENSTGDRSQEYLADQLTQDLITDLSKISALQVLGKDMSFSFKGQSVRTRDLAEEFGVDYVVSGSLGRIGTEIIVSPQLAEARTDATIWSDRKGYELEDIALVWDNVINDIVDELSVELTPTDQALLARAYVPDFRAYDLYLQARELFQSKEAGRLADSLTLYDRAVAADPGWAVGYAGYAQVHADIWLHQALEVVSAAQARGRARAAVATAFELEPDLPEAHAVQALLSLGDGDFDAAIESATRAVEFNPGNIDIRTTLMIVLGYAGRWPEALAAMEAGLALNPRPTAYVATNYAWALFMNREFDAAIEVLEAIDADRDPQENEYTLTGNTVESLLASAYAETGRLEEANRVVGRILAKNPWYNLRHYSAAFSQYALGRDRAFQVEALRKAGVPAGPDFSPDGLELVTGEPLAELIDNKTWRGYDWGREQTFDQFYQRNGSTVYAGASTSLTGTAYVEGNEICKQFDELYWGNPYCGTVYRNPQGSANEQDEYFYVSTLVFSFTVID